MIDMTKPLEVVDCDGDGEAHSAMFWRQCAGSYEAYVIYERLTCGPRSARFHLKTGECIDTPDLRLRNKPERVRVRGFVCVYPDGPALFPNTEELQHSKTYMESNPLAIIDLSKAIGEVEVGHGLEKETE